MNRPDASHNIAAAMAAAVDNGSRRDAAGCLAETANPAWLALATVRHMIANGHDPLDAVVNMQALAARLGGCPQ